MKLAFKKNKESEISVFQVVDNEEREFNYVTMIKDLIKTKKMDDPDILGKFDPEEIASIKSMVKCINEKIASTDELSV